VPADLSKLLKQILEGLQNIKTTSLNIMSRFVLILPSMGPLIPAIRNMACQHQAAAEGAGPSDAVSSAGAGFSTARAV